MVPMSYILILSLNGAAIVRVHDVAATRDALDVLNAVAEAAEHR